MAGKDLGFEDIQLNEEEYEEAVPESTEVQDELDDPVSFKLAIVGLGQCGNNLASLFHKIGYRRVLLINTAQSDLDSIEESKVARLRIGKIQGAGKDPVKGKAAAEDHKLEILNAMNRTFGSVWDKIVVCYGAGGGTGSGSIGTVVELAQKMVKDKGGNPTKDIIVIQTLPDPKVDGPRQSLNALNAYAEVSRFGVAAITVDNASVSQNVKSTLATGFSPANSWVVSTLHRLFLYSAKPSNLGAFDSADFDDVIMRGRLILSATRFQTIPKSEEVPVFVTDRLRRSVLAKTDVSTGSAAALVLVVNPKVADQMDANTLSPLFELVNGFLRKNSTLHRGTYVENWDKKTQDQMPAMMAYLLIGGLDHPMASLQSLFDNVPKTDRPWSSMEVYLGETVPE